MTQASTNQCRSGGSGTGTPSDFCFSGAKDFIVVIANQEGRVSLTVPTEAAFDAAGNANAPSNTLSYVADFTRPNATLSSTTSAHTNANPIVVALEFSEVVKGFTADDLEVTNANVTLTGSGEDFEVRLVPLSQGEVTLRVRTAMTTDLAGNAVEESALFSRVFDTLNPIPAMQFNDTSLFGYNSHTRFAPIPVFMTFHQPVVGFAAGDISVSGGSVSFFSGSGTTYLANIMPSAQGQIQVHIPASAATDLAGNENLQSNTLTFVYDAARPTVAPTSSLNSLTSTSPLTFTATFSEAVGFFSTSDIPVSGTASITYPADVNATDGFSATYTIQVAPVNSSCVVEVSVPAEGSTDQAGNNNTASNVLSRTFDGIAPTVALSATNQEPTKESPLDISIVFSEVVEDFSIADIEVGGVGGSKSNFYSITDDGSIGCLCGKRFHVDVAPSDEGEVTVIVPAGGCTDVAGNDNTASAFLNQTYDITRPNVTLTTTTADSPNSVPFLVTATFTENVTTFVASDVTISPAGSVLTFSGSGSAYTFQVLPAGDGTQAGGLLYSVSVPAARAIDAALNENTASNTLNFQYDTTGPVSTLSSTAAAETKFTPIPVSLEFDEDVIGLNATDLVVTGPNVTSFNGTGAVYTLDLVVAEDGPVTLRLPAGRVPDD